MENYPGNRLPVQRKFSAHRYFSPNMSPICHLAHFTILPTGNMVLPTARHSSSGGGGDHRRRADGAGNNPPPGPWLFDETPVP